LSHTNSVYVALHFALLSKITTPTQKVFFTNVKKENFVIAFTFCVGVKPCLSSPKYWVIHKAVKHVRKLADATVE